MSLPAPPAIRLLLGLITVVILAACSPVDGAGRTVHRIPSWLVLGDSTAVPDAGTFQALVLARSRGMAPDLTDLSAPGAGIEAVIARQVPLLPPTSDLIILALGPSDAGMESALSPEDYARLTAALLHTLRGRGPVIVSAIPEVTPDGQPGLTTFAAATRLRHILRYNAGIQAAAAEYSVNLLDQAVRQPTAERPIAQPRAGEAGAFNASAVLGLREIGPRGAATNWLAGFRGDEAESLRRRATAAAAAGLRLDVVVKLGDSITASPAFLAELTEPELVRAGWPALVGTFRYYSHTPVPSGTDPFVPAGWDQVSSPLARRGFGSDARWYTTDVMVGGAQSALARELEVLQPGVALVMFGTNDLTLMGVDQFSADLDRLLAELQSRSVIPIVSTIPNRQDRADFAARVPDFNAAIRSLATVHRVPLVDYNAAMAALPNAGLSPDGIHPSICPDGAGSLSRQCLLYGYNLRNLLTLQALDELYRTLFADPAVRLVSRPNTSQ
jgi:lysophospholipase L1-like esterase